MATVQVMDLDGDGSAELIEGRIPMGALHDGEGFLVEKYAIAVTPGMTLVDPIPLNRSSPELLLVGVSESVQGFPALPAVEPELAQADLRAPLHDALGDLGGQLIGRVAQEQEIGLSDLHSPAVPQSYTPPLARGLRRHVS